MLSTGRPPETVRSAESADWRLSLGAGQTRKAYRQALAISQNVLGARLGLAVAGPRLPLRVMYGYRVDGLSLEVGIGTNPGAGHIPNKYLSTNMCIRDLTTKETRPSHL